MFKTLLLIGAGVGIGYFVVPMIKPLAAPPPTPITPEEMPAVARMARDFRRACSDLNPLMLQLEAAFRDDSLSVNEGLATLAVLRRLT